LTNEKILEVEDLLESLSDEMLKLKSASKHYEETRENLQNMCESIDKISVTHQKLTGNMRQLLAEMEKMNLEGKKTREYIQSIYDEAKDSYEAEARKNEARIRKAMKLMKSLILLGVFMEAIIIILILLF